MSQITTHVLDTARGKPAPGIAVLLVRQAGDGWEILTRGTTDADGRISHLLPKDAVLPPGEYKMIFETDAYFEAEKVDAFYPVVEIRFYIRDASHYHIPLLLSPFGYSTYRGS